MGLPHHVAVLALGAAQRELLSRPARGLQGGSEPVRSLGASAPPGGRLTTALPKAMQVNPAKLKGGSRTPRTAGHASES